MLLWMRWRSLSLTGSICGCWRPQDATASDVMPADGLLLLTTENIGYMAGLTKDFFDRSYDDLLEQKPGLPVATLIWVGLDGTATRARA